MREEFCATQLYIDHLEFQEARRCFGFILGRLTLQQIPGNSGADIQIRGHTTRCCLLQQYIGLIDRNEKHVFYEWIESCWVCLV